LILCKESLATLRRTFSTWMHKTLP
jgi:hypothetical protein